MFAIDAVTLAFRQLAEQVAATEKPVVLTYRGEAIAALIGATGYERFADGRARLIEPLPARTNLDPFSVGVEFFP